MLYPYGSWRIYKISSSCKEIDDKTFNFNNDDIVDMKYSHGRNYMVILTKTSISIWKTKPRVKIMNLIRDHSFIETFGFHLNVIWKHDATMIVVITDEGWVIIYRLMVNTKEKLYEFPNKMQQYNSYQSIFLQLITMFRLPALCKSIITKKDSFLISTSHGSIESMVWPSVDNLIHHNTLSIHSILTQQNPNIHNLSFDNKTNICITSMDCTPWNGYVGFVFNTGHCGLIYIPTDHIDYIFDDSKYNFTFIDNIIDATVISVNSKFNFLSIGCEDGRILSYRFDVETQTFEKSHENNIKCVSNLFYIGGISLLAWSPDFTTLASCWRSEKIAIWSTFGSLIKLITFSHSIFSNSSFQIKSMEWGLDGYCITIHVMCDQKNSTEKYAHSNNKLFELNFVKFLQIVSGLVFFSGLNYLLVGQVKNLCKYQEKKQNLSQNIWFVLNFPDIYQSNDCHIKDVVVDEKSLNIAVVYDKGYLVYNWNTQKWLNSTLNQHPNEIYVNSGCICWWEGILFLSTYTHDNYNKSNVVCHIINKKFNDNIETIKYFDHVSLYYRIFGNNKLAIYSMDTYIYIFGLELVYLDHEIPLIKSVLLVEEIKISLMNIVPHPLSLINLQLFYDPNSYCYMSSESISNDSPQCLSSLSHSTINQNNYFILLNISGKLIHLTMNEIKQLDIRSIRIIGNCVEYFETKGKFMWTFCGYMGLKLYISNYTTQMEYLESFLLDPSSIIHIQFSNITTCPIEFDMNEMLVNTIHSEKDLSQSENYIFYKLDNIITCLMPSILLKLLLKKYNKEAFQLAKNTTFHNKENLVNNLEILMHDVLVNNNYFTDNKMNIDQIIEMVTNFILQFDEYHEIFCYCARKIEMKLWNKLFSKVGSPIKLFKQCIKLSKFSVASAYLVILNNVESEIVNKKLHSMLLIKLIKHKQWKILHEVFSYLINIYQNSNKNNTYYPLNDMIRNRSVSFSYSTPIFLSKNFTLVNYLSDFHINENNGGGAINDDVFYTKFSTLDIQENKNNIEFFQRIIICRANNFLLQGDILSIFFMLQACNISFKSYIKSKKNNFKQLLTTSKKVSNIMSNLVDKFSYFIQYTQIKYQKKCLINTVLSEKTYKYQCDQIIYLYNCFIDCHLYEWAILFAVIDFDRVKYLEIHLQSLTTNTVSGNYPLIVDNITDIVEKIITVIDKLLQPISILPYKSHLWNNAIRLKAYFIPKSKSYHTSVSEEFNGSNLSPTSGLITNSINSNSICVFNDNIEDFYFVKSSDQLQNIQDEETKNDYTESITNEFIDNNMENTNSFHSRCRIS